MDKLVLSTLAHTWILDLDGTIVKHNGYKIDGEDSFLPGAAEFLQTIPPGDLIVFITSREEQYRSSTEKFLKDHNVRYNSIIFEAPFGERILINDNKNSGLKMACSVCVKRDAGMNIEIIMDEKL